MLNKEIKDLKAEIGAIKLCHCKELDIIELISKSKSKSSPYNPVGSQILTRLTEQIVKVQYIMCKLIIYNTDMPPLLNGDTKASQKVMESNKAGEFYPLLLPLL